MGGPPAPQGQSPGRPLRWMVTSSRKGRTEPRLQADSPSIVATEDSPELTGLEVSEVGGYRIDDDAGKGTVSTLASVFGGPRYGALP